MPREKDDNVYLWDMLDSANTIIQFSTGKTFDDYLNDRMLRQAIERNIEIIGEAARRVSEPFKGAHAEVPWRLTVAQRHVLAHEYGEIKHEQIWRVVKMHIPTLVAQLKTLLPTPPTP